MTVRPIPQLDGETGFAEIFFDAVFVPDEQVLGGIGEGWRVAMSTAGSERGLSLRSPARYTEAAGRLVDAYTQTVSADPPAARFSDEVAKAYIDAHAYELSTWWTASRVLDGHSVGAEASCNKIFWSETDLAIHTAALRLAGPRAELLETATGGDPSSFRPLARRLPVLVGRPHLRRHQ